MQTKPMWLIATLLATGAAACGGDAASDETSDNSDNNDCGGCDAAPNVDEVVLQLHDRGATTMSNATVVAFQDGDGAWQPVVGEGGVYRAVSTTGRYGFFIGCVTTTSRGEYRFATTTETLTQDSTSCAPANLPVEISGVMSGEVMQRYVNVTGYDDAILGEPAAQTYMLRGAAGPTQVLAEIFNNLSGNLIGVRRIDLGNLTTSGTANFPVGGALAPATAPTTINGVNTGDELTTWTGINTGDGTLYFSETPPTSIDAPTYQVLPLALQVPTDKVEVAVYADQPGFAGHASRSVTHYDVDATTTFTLPPVRAFPRLIVDEVAASWELPATLALTPDEGVTATVLSTSNKLLYLFADATPGWLVGRGSLTLEQFTNLPGWDLGFTGADPVEWSIYAWTRDATTFMSSGTSGRMTPSLQAATRRSLHGAAHAHRVTSR